MSVVSNLRMPTNCDIASAPHEAVINMVTNSFPEDRLLTLSFTQESF